MEKNITEKELHYYEKLTKTQKDFVDALKIFGYKHKYFNVYFKLGCLDIDISQIDTLSELLILMHEHGKTHKLWEIQNLLGISSN